MREPWQQRLTGVLVAACCVVALSAQAPRLTPPWATRIPVVRIEQPDIEVAVSGEVVSPGTYNLPFGARVSDLLAAAGGMTRQAATTLVNLADALRDGELVHVPSFHAHTGVERVSLNSASLAELDGLPGIGPVMAKRIVDGRPFSRVDELLKVPGVGPKTLERLRPLVAL